MNIKWNYAIQSTIFVKIFLQKIINTYIPVIYSYIKKLKKIIFFLADWILAVFLGKLKTIWPKKEWKS